MTDSESRGVFQSVSKGVGQVMMPLISHSLGRAVVLFWRQKHKEVDEEEAFFFIFRQT